MRAELRVVDPNGVAGDEYLEYLPDWSALTFSMIRDGSGQVSFTYPSRAPEFASALKNQVVTLLFDGQEPANGRYIRRNRTSERIAPGELTSDVVFKSLPDALRDAQFRAPNQEQTRSWTNATPGRVITDVMAGAIARGALKWWGYRGNTFNWAVDSNGAQWAGNVTVEFTYGQSVYDILEWLRSYGYIEYGTRFGKLEAWIPTTRGRNLADASKIVLWAGEHFATAPEEETFDDYVTDLTVIGDHPTVDTSVQYVYVSSPSKPYGIREKQIRVTGVKIAGVLTEIGQRYIAAYSAPRTSRSYRLTSSGVSTWLPGIAYETGDTIAFAVGSDVNDPSVGVDPITDTQISESVHIISGDFANSLNGNVIITVNDWLDDRDNRIDQLIDRFQGN